MDLPQNKAQNKTTTKADTVNRKKCVTTIVNGSISRPTPNQRKDLAHETNKKLQYNWANYQSPSINYWHRATFPTATLACVQALITRYTVTTPLQGWHLTSLSYSLQLHPRLSVRYTVTRPMWECEQVWPSGKARGWWPDGHRFDSASAVLWLEKLVSC